MRVSLTITFQSSEKTEREPTILENSRLGFIESVLTKHHDLESGRWLLMGGVGGDWKQFSLLRLDGNEMFLSVQHNINTKMSYRSTCPLELESNYMKESKIQLCI